LRINITFFLIKESGKNLSKESSIINIGFMKFKINKVYSIILISLCFSIILVTASRVNANSIIIDSWTWVSGSEFDDQSPLYGLKGIENPNYRPGARQGGATWVDEQNNCFWIFGGYGWDNNSYSGHLNDIWRYNFTSQNWAWIAGSHLRNEAAVYGTQGVFHENNVPGPRYECTSWTDLNGLFWMFGGSGVGDGYRGDLWCFNPSLNQWAWMAGNITDNYSGNYGVYKEFNSSYMPPARRSCTSWVDKNNLFYIFGGQITGSTYANDIWCYNWTLQQFAWVGGSNVTVQNGAYGTPGVFDSSYHPGCRMTSASWYSKELVYIFGGWGRSSTGLTGYLNDLWVYNITLDQWAWMSGSDATNSPGSYGTKGLFGPTNNPPARRHGVSCVDINDNLYLFGGYSPISGGGLMNDLWHYDVDTWQWAWISGNNTVNVGGKYGVQGTADTSNYIGGRQRTSMHCDTDGYIYIFGGHGYDSISDTGVLNDLWIYVPYDLIIISEFQRYQFFLLLILGIVPLGVIIRRKWR
jgi:N-acetylneuraminic acid mutarotase